MHSWSCLRIQNLLLRLIVSDIGLISKTLGTGNKDVFVDAAHITIITTLKSNDRKDRRQNVQSVFCAPGVSLLYANTTTNL